MYRFLLISILSLFTILAEGQVENPEPFKKYQLISSEGFAFGYVDGGAKQCVPDEYAPNQAFEFVKTEDDSTYYIKSTVDDSYVCKITSSWNAWDITFESSLPSEVSRAKYSIEALDSGFVMIKNMHAETYVGVRNDAIETGWGIYLNLTYDEHLNNTVKICWKIKELPVDAETLFNESCSKLISFSEELNEYPGMQVAISDFLMEVTDKAMGASSANDVLYYDCISDIEEYREHVDSCLEYVSGINDLYDECDANFVSDVHYPDFASLEDVYNFTKEAFASESTGIDDYISVYDSLKNTLKNYYESQIPYATEDKPADLTYFIKHPNFRYAYKYSSDCEATSDGWVSDASGELPGGYTNIGPQHKYSGETGRDVTCFAGWSRSYDVMGVYQDLADLPDGKYKVVCDGFTEMGKVYKQRAYASADGETVVDTATAAMSGAWETFETPIVNVMNGKLRIGFYTESPDEGGDIGWFLVTDFRLKYCGTVSEDEISLSYNEMLNECRSLYAKMLFSKDKAQLGDSIAEYENLTNPDDMATAVEVLVAVKDEAQKSLDKQSLVMNGILHDLQDSVSAGTFVDEYADMAQGFCNGMMNAVESQYATYKDMDSIQAIVQYFYDAYLPVFRKADEAYVIDADAGSVLTENINRQVESFKTIVQLPSIDDIDKYISELETAVDECVIADLILSGTTDYTAALKNPTIDCSSRWVIPEGWNIELTGSGNGEIVSSGEQVDGDAGGCYLSAWNGTPGKVLLNAYQTVEDLPNGVYELQAMVRTNFDEGSYLYAVPDNDSSRIVLKELKMEIQNLTELGGPTNSAGEDSIAAIANIYGSIFADLYKRTNGGADANDAQSDTLNTNNGKGWGWFYDRLEVEVKNHSLSVGFTNDSVFTMKYGGRPFGGTWISADNFTLRLLQDGDNTGWHPATSIEDVADEMDGTFEIRNGAIYSNGAIYNLNGIRFSSGTKLPSGIYIVKYGRSVQKILMR